MYSKIKFGLRQIILDPSYDISNNNKLIEKLIEIKRKDGIISHGSFIHTIILINEGRKNQLEDKLKFEINKNRQHWLNYDERLTPKFHQELFEIDSTLGWNNCIGFRASVASKYRPYDHLNNNPLIFYNSPGTMDSNIYDYGNGKELEKIESGIEMIDTCSKLKNTEFSISWHSRTCSKDYNWSFGYLELIKIFKTQS